ncbi:hypothetical protein QZH41_019832 [Actinostola sp. cb2023]|nr:hypothetical protein QZH41_019832 [Actinostola sp. cb2023]
MINHCHKEHPFLKHRQEHQIYHRLEVMAILKDQVKMVVKMSNLLPVECLKCELDVTLPGMNGGKDRHFKLTVKYAAQVCVDDLNQFLDGKRKMVPEAVQALDIVLRQIPSLHFTPVGRSFFPTNSRGFDLGGGCEVRSGFYQSIRPSQWKTMLVNIDVSSKAFMKAQPVIDLLCELLPHGESQRMSDRRWQMKPGMAREFLDAIKGLYSFKVETCHIPGMKRKYVVMDLGKNASTYKFQLQDENEDASKARTISVEQYFKEKYNLQLRYPHLPCLMVGQKKNHLPMEVCHMVSSTKRKLTDTQTAEMIKKVTRPPRERQKDIIEWVENILSNLVSHYRDLQLVVVVLPPQGNKEVYKEVKRVGDTVLGIPTQCVQTKQFIPAKPQVCSNIAMKINVKLGGTNHIVDHSEMPPLFRDVIIFGADVTHPSPGEGNIPSIAAVVASMDCHASRYAARVRAQTHIKDKSAQEIILDMAAMVKELLIEFYKQTKIKPKRIIFYRDGVSEGQFDQVLLHEVRAVQQACLELQKEYQPPITFLVVQKRHHARFFCTDKKDESGRAGNVPPGTMVDRGITHPFEFDFYLCSHQGIQGTSRPTHYHVLYDDNNFSANDLHKLTYHLCHTYARCTRSVSLPSPAYYAHLVAFRARHHINGLAS